MLSHFVTIVLNLSSWWA